MYGLLTKCEVKMTGYWPRSFFVCIGHGCLGTETTSRSINSQKKMVFGVTLLSKYSG